MDKEAVQKLQIDYLIECLKASRRFNKISWLLIVAAFAIGYII